MATRFVDDFRDVCMAHPRDDARVRQKAAHRRIPMVDVMQPGRREPSRFASVNAWDEGQAWSCLLSQQEDEDLVPAQLLTEILTRWDDGTPVLWSPPGQRARDQMPLLYSTRRRVGDDIQMIRANRLRGHLVLYLEVTPVQ